MGWKKLDIASLIARNPPRQQDGICLGIILEKHDNVLQLIGHKTIMRKAVEIAMGALLNAVVEETTTHIVVPLPANTMEEQESVQTDLIRFHNY